MAFWKIKNIAIRGVAATVPNNPVKSADLCYFTKEEADTFDKTVGIKNRYIATENVCASDLCYDAALRLLDGLGWDKNTIDVLLFSSITGDYKTPPTSSILQYRLDLPTSTFVLDVPMGCCDCLYSFNIAGNLLTSGAAKRALVLIGDTTSRMSSPKDKSRGPLFGDCGTAIAMEYDETADEISIELNTYGEGYRALMTPHGGYRHPITKESFEYEDFGNGIIRAPKDALINGMDVFSFAISKPPLSAKSVIEKLGLDKDNDVDYYLIHQANKMIVDRIVRKLQLNIDKVPYNLQDYGNTGGASIPLLMVTNLSEQLATKPLTLLGISFGLGLTWGAMMLKTKPMIVLPLSYL